MLAADLDILARTVYGEARGEPWVGKKAVAHVVLNRVKAKHRRETRIAGAATEPYQFSCWNEDDPNVRRLESVTLSDPTFRRCYKAALDAIEEQMDGVDPTKGSTHYHARSISPGWAQGHTPVYGVGAHVFYNTVK